MEEQSKKARRGERGQRLGPGQGQGGKRGEKREGEKGGEKGKGGGGGVRRDRSNRKEGQVSLYHMNGPPFCEYDDDNANNNDDCMYLTLILS